MLLSKSLALSLSLFAQQESAYDAGFVWLLRIALGVATVLAAAYLWTTTVSFYEKVAVSAIVSISILAEFTGAGYYSLIPFIMQVVVGIWAALRFQYD